MIASATIKTASEIGSVIERSAGEIEKRIAATRFMWMPGINPVIVPIVMPMINAKTNENIILYSED